MINQSNKIVLCTRVNDDMIYVHQQQIIGIISVEDDEIYKQGLFALSDVELIEIDVTLNEEFHPIFNGLITSDNEQKIVNMIEQMAKDILG